MAGRYETGYGFGTGRNYNYSTWENVSRKAGQTKEFQLNICHPSIIFLSIFLLNNLCVFICFPNIIMPLYIFFQSLKWKSIYFQFCSLAKGCIFICSNVFIITCIHMYIIYMINTMAHVCMILKTSFWFSKFSRK